MVTPETTCPRGEFCRYEHPGRSPGRGAPYHSGCPTCVAQTLIAEGPAIASEYLLHRVSAGDSGAVQEVIARYGGLVWSLGVTLAGYLLGSQIPGIDTLFRLVGGAPAPDWGCVKPDIVPGEAASGAQYNPGDPSNGNDQCL